MRRRTRNRSDQFTRGYRVARRSLPVGLLTLALFLVVACSDAPTTALPSRTAPVTSPTVPAATREADPRPADSPAPGAEAPAALDETYPPMPGDLDRVEVTKVVDGDTVDVLLDGREERLRLIGLDTPETVHPSRPVECFGKEASARARELLQGQTIFLEADPTQDDRDRYNRLLRYIWFPDGRLFNLEMIAGGYAHEYTYNVPYTYQSAFKAAERQAREQLAGLWAPESCNGDTTQPAALEAEEAPGNPATATPAGDTVAPAQDGEIFQELVNLTSPISPGERATITVRTVPGVDCSIVVYYKSGASSARGLEPVRAGEDGLCTWSWSVGSQTTAGQWRIEVATGPVQQTYTFVVQ